MNNVISKKLILGALFLVLYAALSMQCDPENEYSVQNKSSGRILRCLDCRDCNAGSEPKIPCGSVIGIDESIGDCQDCKDGYYSTESDVWPCQKCQNCSNHEIILGACNCTGSCEEGYVMSSKGTCEPPQKTTMDPILSNKKDGEPGLSIAEIVLIVLGALVLVAIPIVGVCWHFKCRRNSRQNSLRGCHKDDENSSANTSTTLLNETKDEVIGTIIQQEESQQNGLPTSDGPHVLETTGGFVETSPTASNNLSGGMDTSQSPPEIPNVSHSDTKIDYMVNTPPTRNDSVIPEMPVQSPAQQAIVGLQPPPPMVQNNARNHNHDRTKFDSWLFDLYDEICETFDLGAPGKNWKALARNLGFTVIEVRRFDAEKNKTDVMIQSWMADRENTVVKFGQILNAMGMTSLTDKINDYIV